MRTIRTGSALRRSGVAMLVAAALTFTALASAAEARPEGAPTSTAGDVVGWGDETYEQQAAPELPDGTSYRAITGGNFTSLALRSDGHVVGFGLFAPVPPALGGSQTYVAVSAGFDHFLYLRSDGQIATSGADDYLQRDFPATPAGVRYTAVSAGTFYSLGLRSDGRIAVAGKSALAHVPALPAGMTYTAISAGWQHAVALRSDGNVVGWGAGSKGETTTLPLPSGVRYTAVSAGLEYTLALRSDGKVVGWGDNTDGRATPPNPPSGSRFVEVAAAFSAGAALTSTGKIVTWGSPDHGALDVPVAPAGTTYSAIAAGGYHFLALTSRTTSITGAAPHGWRYGSAAKLAVKAAAVGVTPAGSVSVYRGSTLLGKATLSSGRAVIALKAKALKPGSYNLTVKYPGATALAPSSRTVKVTVAKGVAVAKSGLVKSSVKRGSTPKVKVVVKAKGVTPTGKVRVYDGKKTLKTVTLHTKNHGKVTVTLSKKLKVGKHKIKVVYLGSSLVSKDAATTKTLKIKR